ncbi:MAG TPA: MFS transporter, partial [Lacipirellulaceae bacterium]|nr:MFS transporter [Lacipirellulaceae bacterium]
LHSFEREDAVSQNKSTPESVSIPSLVWLLGFVSLCMDLSSEMIYALLPVFLVSVLGASKLTLGVIEGIAEGTASIVKVFSGVISDRAAGRKPLVVFGYSLATFSKPLFALANSAGWVLVARFIDRLGKGIRGAPRDALIADVTPAEVRGAAYGLRQALDTVGALLGPLAAIGLMIVFGGSMRHVFWVAVLPAVVAVGTLVVGVAEPERHLGGREKAVLPTWRDIRPLAGSYWFVVTIGAVFTLARFSEAFLIVRANQLGLAMNWTPLVLAVMNVTYVASAYPAGVLSDQIGRVSLLTIGLVMLIVADLILATTGSLYVVLLGAAVWGLHLGLTQGLLSALVADTATVELRGTAFGVFNFVSGVAAILASIVAGAVWELWSPAATFYVGAILSAIALGGLSWWWWRASQYRQKHADGEGEY